MDTKTDLDSAQRNSFHQFPCSRFLTLRSFKYRLITFQNPRWNDPQLLQILSLKLQQLKKVRVRCTQSRRIYSVENSLETICQQIRVKRKRIKIVIAETANHYQDRHWIHPAFIEKIHISPIRLSDLTSDSMASRSSTYQSLVRADPWKLWSTQQVPAVLQIQPILKQKVVRNCTQNRQNWENWIAGLPFLCEFYRVCSKFFRIIRNFWILHFCVVL